MSRRGDIPADFWSRRQARVREEALAEARATEAAEARAREAALEERPDEEILEELGLPDPDTLGPGDDVRAFMEKAVPDRLRRRALRRLWLSNPALANLDGLLDYGEDFTDSATVIEKLQTAYQVGKGMLAHVEEMARQAEAEGRQGEEDVAEGEALADATAEGADETGADEAETGEEAAPEVAACLTGPQVAEEDAQEAPASPPRRRMQFTFGVREGGAA